MADSAAPPVGVEGVDVLVLGEADGLEEGLGEIGEGAGGAGLDVTAGYAGDEAAEGSGEIAGGEVFAGKEIGEVVGELTGGASLGVFAGVVGAEMGMAGGAGSAALAAIGEGETTQGLAVVLMRGRRAADRTKRGHGCLLELD
jgi:hypothetical protein